MPPVPSHPPISRGYGGKNIEGTIMKEKLRFREKREKVKEKELTDAGTLLPITQGLLRCRARAQLMVRSSRVGLENTRCS